MAIQEIKNSIIEKLQKYNYYVRPTPLKAIRTGRVGWMYLAHPDLTHRGDFQKFLSPLIHTRFGREVEFSIAPEMLTVESENSKMSYRVLIVRTAYDDLERMRIFLTEAFADNSTMSIAYLARYTFVPVFPVGGITRKHLQNLLRLQKQFNEKVFWYNLIGVRNIDSQHVLKSSTQSHKSVSQEVLTQPTDLNEDADMPLATDPGTNESDLEETPKIQETRSLRMHLYMLINSATNQNIIHAVYPSADDTKTFVLCSETNKEDVLRVLQGIEELVDEAFEPSARASYFREEEGMKPYVHNFPILDATHTDYVNSLIELSTGVSNPQDDSPPEHTPQFQQRSSYASAISPSPTKRMRNGTSKQKSSTDSNLPQGFISNIQPNEQFKKSFEEASSKLQYLETKEKETQGALDALSSRMDKQGEEINLLGTAVAKTNEKVDLVCTTQNKQADTMVQMNQSLHTLLREVSKLNDYNEQFSDMAESSQGGGVDQK